MIKHYTVLFLILIFSYLPLLGQQTIEVRDLQSNKLLKCITVAGIQNYTVEPNGIIKINETVLNASDSVIICKEGYETRVLYPPFNNSPLLIYTKRLSENLEAVVIAVDQSAREWRKSTASVALQKATNLLAQKELVLNQQLNSLPGVFMQTGTNNTNRLTIRGVGSRTPYSSNRIRAYLGNFPLTDGNGVTVIEDLPPAIIESIEVLKGPAAALYGSGLGGIVQINPIQLDNKKNILELYTQAGSFGRKMIGTYGTLNANTFGLQTHVSKYNSNGFRENNKYERESVFVNARKQLANTNISLLVLYTRLYGEIPSSLNKIDYENNPEKAAENWLGVDGHEKYQRLGTNLEFSSIIGEHLRNELNLNFRYHNPYEVRPFNILDEETYAAGFTNRLKYYTENWQISFSGHMARENYNWATYEIVNKNQGEKINQMEDRKLHTHAGMLVEWLPSNKLVLKAGASFNYIRYQLNDLLETNEALEKHGFDPVFSPTVGINYEVNQNINIYSSVSHGFSPPSLEETLLPDGLVNTDLQPEKGILAETGFRCSLKNIFRFSATLYTMKVTNMVVTRRLAEDQFMGINAGEVNHRGIELQAMLNSSRLIENPSIEFNVTSTFSYSKNKFIDFIDEDNDFAGNYLPGIPQYNWHNSLRIQLLQKHTMNIDFFNSGQQYITDDNTETYNGHHIANISFHTRFGEINKSHMKLSAGIRNIYNSHYASMLLVNASSFGGNLPRNYYPGTPRNLFVSVSLHL